MEVGRVAGVAGIFQGLSFLKRGWKAVSARLLVS